MVLSLMVSYAFSFKHILRNTEKTGYFCEEFTLPRVTQLNLRTKANLVTPISVKITSK